MTCIGTYTHQEINDGNPIPFYEMGSSINTVDGWNALAAKYAANGEQPVGNETVTEEGAAV
ncbi:hypothetical protein LJC63_12345 [Ruminococcaceae bacterium OttesenSCG-928-L11]|nr:hypothetical protein [Ruminococcaceae bacterium OttesenSCG-928-L11]